MKRFTGVAPRVNIAKPTIDIDTEWMNKTQTSKMLIDSKHYIKHNMRQVTQIETQMKTQTEEELKQKELLQKKISGSTPKGYIPKYLQQRKAEQESEII